MSGLAESDLAAARKLGAELTSLDGAGDEAYLIMAEKKIYIRVTEDLVSIEVRNIDDAAATAELLTSLAPKVADRVRSMLG